MTDKPKVHQEVIAGPFYQLDGGIKIPLADFSEDKVPSTFPFRMFDDINDVTDAMDRGAPRYLVGLRGFESVTAAVVDGITYIKHIAYCPEGNEVTIYCEKDNSFVEMYSEGKDPNQIRSRPEILEVLQTVE